MLPRRNPITFQRCNALLDFYPTPSSFTDLKFKEKLHRPACYILNFQKTSEKGFGSLINHVLFNKEHWEYCC